MPRKDQMSNIEPSVAARNRKALERLKRTAGGSEGLPSGIKPYWSLLKRAAEKWSDDHAPRLGAALSYYTVFSLVPLLVIIIAVVGIVIGKSAAEEHILAEISSLISDQSAAALKEMIQRAQEPTTGMVATLVALGTLVFGASGVFGQLQDALNTVWGVAPKTGRGVWGFVRDRFLSILAVMGTAFLLLVSLAVSASLAAVGEWMGSWLPGPEALLHALNLVVSLMVMTGLFAMMFKLLPDADIAWRDVWRGAVITAVLFTLGKYLLGLYIGKSEIASGYGAAGSLVVIMVWVYYSAQIFLFGAEFAQVYAEARGTGIHPSEDAVEIDVRPVAHARDM